MKSLHQRLATLDHQTIAYELDYIVMKSGFVYRNARVLSHDEDTLFISQEDHPETYIKTSEIATLRIVRL